ncbi:hypothetical protein [Halorussus halobius]|nr:hypothetical protein [Halorussus halobius]
MTPSTADALDDALDRTALGDTFHRVALGEPDDGAGLKGAARSRSV